MKKYILGFIILSLVFIIPMTTKAATLDDLAKQISSLTAQISQLKAQMGAAVLKAPLLTPVTKTTLTPVTTTACLPPTPTNPGTPPWIKVTSPNGGETFTTDQQIPVRWTSCNVSSSDYVRLSIEQLRSADGAITDDVAGYSISTGTPLVPNTGSAIIRAPKTLVFSSFIPGAYYKISIQRMASGNFPYSGIVDSSVHASSYNVFTINNPGGGVVVTPQPAAQKLVNVTGQYGELNSGKTTTAPGIAISDSKQLKNCTLTAKLASNSPTNSTASWGQQNVTLAKYVLTASPQCNLQIDGILVDVPEGPDACKDSYKLELTGVNTTPIKWDPLFDAAGLAWFNFSRSSASGKFTIPAGTSKVVTIKANVGQYNAAWGNDSVSCSSYLDRIVVGPTPSYVNGQQVMPTYTMKISKLPLKSSPVTIQ